MGFLLSLMLSALRVIISASSLLKESARISKFALPWILTCISLILEGSLRGNIVVEGTSIFLIAIGSKHTGNLVFRQTKLAGFILSHRCGWGFVALREIILRMIKFA